MPQGVTGPLQDMLVNENLMPLYGYCYMKALYVQIIFIRGKEFNAIRHCHESGKPIYAKKADRSEYFALI